MKRTLSELTRANQVRASQFHDFQTFARKLASNDVLRLNLQEMLLLLRMIHGSFDGYIADRISLRVQAAYCARADVPLEKCVELIRTTHKGDNDWLDQRATRVFAELTNSSSLWYSGSRRAAQLAELIARLFDERVDAISPDDKKGYLVRGSAVQGIIYIATQLADRKPRLNDPTAATLQSVRRLFAQAKKILTENPRDPLVTESLKRIAKAQLKATLVTDATDTAADILTSSAREEVVRTLLARLNPHQTPADIPQLDVVLNTELATFIGVQIPLAISAAAFKGDDPVLGRNAARVAESVLNGTPARTLRNDLLSTFSDYVHLRDWEKFETASSLYRTMAPQLYRNIDSRQARRALALVYYKFMSVKKGDEYVRPGDDFDWRGETALTYARAVGLTRENGVAASLEFLQKVYQNRHLYRLHRELLDALIESHYFREAIDLSLDESVPLNGADRTSLLRVAAGAAEGNDHEFVRQVANWFKANAREYENDALRLIVEDYIRNEQYTDAAEVLVNMGPDREPEMGRTDNRRLWVTDGLLREGKLRRAVEVVNSVHNVDLLVEGYLSVGLYLSR